MQRTVLSTIAVIATMATAGSASAADQFFCNFEKLNSNFGRVDSFQGLAYSENNACYQAERDCRYDLRAGERCQKVTSGEYGWMDEDVEVLCESRSGRSTECRLGGEALDTGKLYHQHSQSKCVQGTDWGAELGSDTMWVRDGCRGDFIFRVRAFKEAEHPPFPNASRDPAYPPNGGGNGGGYPPPPNGGGYGGGGHGGGFPPPPNGGGYGGGGRGGRGGYPPNPFNQ